jgi:hypothetical protein
MAMNWASSVGMIAVASWIAGGTALPAYAQAPVETPPVLRAADLVPVDLLQGPHHRVEPQVPTDGLLAWFTITSDFGTFRVAGPDMVRVRVGEVRALAELDKTTKSEVFAQALGEAAKRTGRSLQAVVENPAETVKALPEGVGRFFDRVGQAARAGVQQTREQKQEGSGELAGETAARAAGEVFGYYDARRRLAKRVGVDPYTTNPVLAKKLDEIAWAAFAGEFGIDRAVAIVPGLRGAAWFSDLVWETPPGDLRVMIEKKLLELGAPPDAVDRFLRHRWYTLTLRTALMGGLDALSNVAGRAQVVAWANTATSEEQARFVVTAVTMLARLHRTTAPVAALRVAGTLLATGRDAALLVPAPVDYVAWTKRVQTFANRPDLKAAVRGVWLTGQASPRVREQFGHLGWRIHERVPAETVSPR